MTRIFNPTELGALVRRQRKSQGLRQDELALAAGTGVRFIGDLEKGKPTAQLDATLRVLHALGLHVDVGPVHRDVDA